MSAILRKLERSCIERNARGSANNPFLFRYGVMGYGSLDMRGQCIGLKILTGIFSIVLMHKENL